MRVLLSTSVLVALLALPAAARADDWHERYARARTELVDGKWLEAETELMALANDAPTESDRVLAFEMAKLAASWGERRSVTYVQAPPPRAIRGTDELTLLYTTAFLYGVGSGVWYLLETKPDAAVTATLPFAAITAAPVIAVATLDGARKFDRGVPHAISAGVYLGLGEGIWIAGYQNARAARIANADPSTDVRWKPESVAAVLWGGATLGGVLGGALGATVPTTPGRVSFAASTTMWSGAISGLAAGALASDDPHRAERAYGIAGAGYNVGLAGGLLFAGDVSPSVARVRIVDLLGLGGALAASGTYLSAAGHADLRTTEGLAAGGAALGLAAGWLLTRNMPRDVTPPPSDVVVNPSIAPVAGGATIGATGIF